MGVPASIGPAPAAETMTATPRRRVGLLGGTFDPPHVGHLIAAEEARVALRLDEVRLVVAGAPWMKEAAAPAPDRVAMCRLAVAGDQHLVVDDRETRRPSPTYTVETLEELHREEPETGWVFLLGADAAAHLEAWHRSADCLALAEFVVLSRPGWQAADLPEGLRDRLGWLDITAVGISSTELRRRFATGGAVRYLVPEPVEAYIREHRLYGAGA